MSKHKKKLALIEIREIDQKIQDFFGVILQLRKLKDSIRKDAGLKKDPGKQLSEYEDRILKGQYDGTRSETKAKLSKEVEAAPELLARKYSADQCERYTRYYWGGGREIRGTGDEGS